MSIYSAPVCRGSWALGNNCRTCERCIETRPTLPVTDTPNELVERLRESARAFRKYPLYNSDGDGFHLTVQADECDQAADTIEAQQAEIARLREALGEARLQLEYLDSRFPTGTTPPVIARIAALEGES